MHILVHMQTLISVNAINFAQQQLLFRYMRA